MTAEVQMRPIVRRPPFRPPLLICACGCGRSFTRTSPARKYYTPKCGVPKTHPPGPCKCGGIVANPTRSRVCFACFSAQATCLAKEGRHPTALYQAAKRGWAITPEIVEKWREMYASWVDFTDIGREYGISDATVRKYVTGKRVPIGTVPAAPVVAKEDPGPPPPPRQNACLTCAHATTQAGHEGLVCGLWRARYCQPLSVTPKLYKAAGRAPHANLASTERGEK